MVRSLYLIKVMIYNFWSIPKFIITYVSKMDCGQGEVNDERIYELFVWSCVIGLSKSLARHRVWLHVFNFLLCILLEYHAQTCSIVQSLQIDYPNRLLSLSILQLLPQPTTSHWQPHCQRFEERRSQGIMSSISIMMRLLEYISCEFYLAHV